MLIFATALLAAACVCWLILRLEAWHIAITGDEPIGSQKFHHGTVPRVGGLGIFLGFLVGIGTLVLMFGDRLGAFSQPALLGAGAIAFTAGFTEDLTGKVSARARLLVTMLAAAVVFFGVGARLAKLDVALLDAALAYWPVSLALTLVALAGVAHAMNIIDGYNGLSAGVACIALTAFAVVARQVHDPLLVRLCLALAGACVGFLLFNFPGGRIFQGDGGAYFTGFMLAVIALLLVARNPGVSPWFPLVVLAYPVWETLFSASRRVLVHGTPAGEPDALHLHSLVYRRITSRLIAGGSGAARVGRNAWTTPPFWVLTAALSTCGIAFYKSTPALIMLSFGFAAFYCVAYLLLQRLPEPAVAAPLDAGEVTIKNAN